MVQVPGHGQWTNPPTPKQPAAVSNEAAANPTVEIDTNTRAKIEAAKQAAEELKSENAINTRAKTEAAKQAAEELKSENDTNTRAKTEAAKQAAEELKSENNTQADSPEDPEQPTAGGGGKDPPQPPPRNAFDDSWSSVKLREWTTVIIALLIVVSAVLVLVFMFFMVDGATVTEADVKNPALLEAQQEARDTTFQNRLIVLNIAIGILGIVTGYFFGRIPSERRAEKSEAAAQAAAQESKESKVQTTESEANRQAAETAQANAESKVKDVNKTLGAISTLIGPSPSRAKTLGLPAGDVPSEPKNVEAAALLADLQRRLGE